MYSTSRLYHTISLRATVLIFKATGILSVVQATITSKQLLKDSEVTSAGTLNMAPPN